MTQKLALLIETFICGNLADAKKRARNKPHRILREAYQEFTGCSDRKAALAADYLKGYATFQEYADAE